MASEVESRRKYKYFGGNAHVDELPPATSFFPPLLSRGPLIHSPSTFFASTL